MSSGGSTAYVTQTQWPLVGREAELEFLHAAVTDPSSPGLLIAGAAGVGKSRLLREAIAALDQHHVEYAVATHSAQALPFGAFSHLLPEDIGHVPQIDVLPALGRELDRRAAGRPVVLAVDDVQLLDELSAAFVHYVVASGAAKVLLTARSGEPAPDGVLGLYHDRAFTRVELQGLSRDEFREVLEAALSGPIETSAERRLWEVAAGNLLFLRELLLDAGETGALSREHGLWRWDGDLSRTPRLVEAVLRSLAGLPAEQRRALDVIAMTEPVAFQWLERLDQAWPVEALERRGLVRVERAERRVAVRIAFPLVGQALRETLPAAERRRLATRLVDAIEGSGARRREDALPLVLWRDEAGLPSDVTELVAAAAAANDRGDFETAERFARRHADHDFGSALELGRALLAQRRFDATVALLDGWIGDEPEERRALFVETLTYALAYGFNRIGDALDVIEAAEQRTAGPVVRAALRAQTAVVLTQAQRCGDSVALARQAREVEDESVRLRALLSPGVAAVYVGRLDRALAMTEDLIHLGLSPSGSAEAAEWLLVIRVNALLFAGRLAEAVHLVDRVLAEAPPGAWHYGNAHRARASILLGRGRQALRNALEAAHYAGPDDVGRAWCLALASEAAALFGDTAQARDLARESRETDDAVPGYAPDEIRALAWVDVAEGRITSAQEQLWSAVELARAGRQRVFELSALHDLLRLGDAAAAPRIIEVGERVDGALSRAMKLHASGTSEGDVTVLEEAAEAFATIGAALLAAEVWTQVEAETTLRGLRARAAAAARRAHEQLAGTDAAPTPALAAASAPVALSRREREVATLAARGLPNAEIAAELSVSVRTVESHLYAAFAKLGVTDRKQLADVLGASAPD